MTCFCQSSDRRLKREDHYQILPLPVGVSDRHPLYDYFTKLKKEVGDGRVVGIYECDCERSYMVSGTTVRGGVLGDWRFLDPTALVPFPMPHARYWQSGIFAQGTWCFGLKSVYYEAWCWKSIRGDLLQKEVPPSEKHRFEMYDARYLFRQQNRTVMRHHFWRLCTDVYWSDQVKSYIQLRHVLVHRAMQKRSRKDPLKMARDLAERIFKYNFKGPDQKGIAKRLAQFLTANYQDKSLERTMVAFADQECRRHGEDGYIHLPPAWLLHYNPLEDPGATILDLDGAPIKRNEG